MYINRFTAFTICFLCYSALSAQIELVLPTHNMVLEYAERPVQNRSVSLDTLPFVDDFAVEGPFPDPNLWLDNQVFINTDLAVSPPSIGVATFDGLDETGSPYGLSGAGDTLTSVGINLDIPVNDLNLSFFIQARGRGDQPEMTDSLVLEFKNMDGEWEIEESFVGIDSPTAVSDFIFVSVRISNTRFLHDDFQFRFRNKSSGRGAIDFWHLDMVRLINNQAPSETFLDVAFQYPPQGILNRYSAMPSKHFQTNTSSHLREEFTLNVFNHFDVARPIGSTNSLMEINELTSGQNVTAPRQYVPGADLNINANSSLEIEITENFSVSSSIANSNDALLFETSFSINPVESDNDPGLFTNNFVSRETVIDDYFAYDDGTSEFGLQAQGPGTNVAVEFQTTVKDTLTAIAIHFPRIKEDVTNQFFNLKVWLDDLESEPVYEELFSPIYADTFFDTLQGFTTYRLQDPFSGVLQPVDIDANTTFYIGWEQVSNEFIDAIPVGFDSNTKDVAQYNFFFSPDEGEWFNFGSQGFDGALLLRPIMGAENAIFTSVGETADVRGIKVYPNPNNTGLLNIEFEDLQNQIKELRLIDLHGRTVLTKQEQYHQIELPNVVSGFYFINFVDQSNNIIYREKLIIQDK